MTEREFWVRIDAGVLGGHIDVPGVGERIIKFGAVKKRPQLDR